MEYVSVVGLKSVMVLSHSYHMYSYTVAFTTALSAERRHQKCLLEFMSPALPLLSLGDVLSSCKMALRELEM